MCNFNLGLQVTIPTICIGLSAALARPDLKTYYHVTTSFKNEQLFSYRLPIRCKNIFSRTVKYTNEVRYFY